MGYLILALIAVTTGMLALGTTVPDLGELALLPLLGAALLFFPFWLPAVVLGRFGKKVVHRFAETANDTNVKIGDHGAT